MKKNQLYISMKMLINGILLFGILLNCSAQKSKNKSNQTDNILLYGTVVSDSGKTIQGAAIVMECAQYNKRGVRLNDKYFTVDSDSDGNFSIGLPSIPFKIEASRAGYFNSIIENPDTTQMAKGIKLTLASGGKIKVLIDGLSRNELGSLDIKAVTHGKEYVANNKLTLIAASLSENPATGHIEADNNGFFLACCYIEGVPAGDCSVIFENNGKTYSRNVEIAGGTINDVSFDLKPPLFTLSGNVTKNGNPMAGYFLIFQLVDERYTGPAKGYSTDINGRYVMKLDSGLYKIQITVPSITELDGVKVKAYKPIYSTPYSLTKNDNLNFELDDLKLTETMEND